MPKIIYVGLPFKSLNQQYLLSSLELNYLLTSQGSPLCWLWGSQRPSQITMLSMKKRNHLNHFSSFTNIHYIYFSFLIGWNDVKIIKWNYYSCLVSEVKKTVTIRHDANSCLLFHVQEVPVYLQFVERIFYMIVYKVFQIIFVTLLM